MSGNKQCGVLTSWFEHGYGFIIAEKRQQYFLHVSAIIQGPAIPVRGSTVEFEVGPPHKNGKLPTAINAVIFPDGSAK
jgi:cold shock CspA family protein